MEGGVLLSAAEFEQYLKQWGEEMHGEDEFGEGRVPRNGNPRFYKLLDEMAATHDKKSHDYASNDNPSGNYHFAGRIAQMFAHSPEDAGFATRIAEKIYRLANLEANSKHAKNESIEDTERDIAVITCLWMADRQDRRAKLNPVAMQETDIESAAASPKTMPAADMLEVLRLILSITERVKNLIATLPAR